MRAIEDLDWEPTPSSDLIPTEKFVAGEWVPVLFHELRKGDWFRQYDLDGNLLDQSGDGQQHCYGQAETNAEKNTATQQGYNLECCWCTEQEFRNKVMN